MMDSNTVLNFEPVSSLPQTPTVTRTPVTIQDHAQAPAHQLQINILNENGNNYHAPQNVDVDSAPVDTSVTDSLFPFIDELCLETKNVARFGVKLMSLKVIDKKKFDHIMEESDEYARIYKLYNEAFELNAGQKLVQALQASGNGNVVEFLRQNVGDPTILFDVEEVQQLQQIVQPVQIIQIQPNANFRSQIQSSSSSAATSAAAATLLLLDSSSHNNNNIPHRMVQQHHQTESTSVPVAVSIPVTVPSTSIHQNQIHTSHLPDHNHRHHHQQQILHQFTTAKQQIGLEKVEIQSAAVTVGSFEDLLHQSLSVAIPQLSPLTVPKEHNSSVTISVDQNTSIISQSTSVRTSDSTNNGSRKFSRNKESSGSGTGSGSGRKSNRQKRKKKAVPEEWEKNRNKLLRMQGQEYMGYKKSKDGGGVEKSILIVRKKRSIGPPCSSPKCLLGKCTSCLKFTQEDREELFQNFWLRMTWEQRKIYVSSLVDVVTVKRHKKDLNEESRRTSSLRYMLKLHGEKQRVCKTMFLSTLGIGDYSVRSWVLKHGGFPPVFSRSGGVGHSLRRSQSKLSSNNNSSSTSNLRKKKNKQNQSQEDESNNISTMVNNNCSVAIVPSSSSSSYVVSTNANNVNHLRTIECTDISTGNVHTNTTTNSGTHFLVKDYFDSLVKMPQDYLHIVQDN